MEIIDLLIHKTLRTPQDLGLEFGVELKCITLITKDGNKFCDDDLNIKNAKAFCRSLELPPKDVSFSNAQ